METLQISKSNALKAFNGAKDEGRTLLFEIFGEEVFSQKITDRIKTFQDAIEIVEPSENLSVLLSYNGIDKVLLSAQAAAKLMIIAEALNEAWKPNWDNSSQYKWAPWFRLDKPGFRFNVSFYYDAYAGSSGGSRLCFHSEELANYAGQQFLDIYKDLLA